MFFTAFDIAPETGDYRMVGADGHTLGVVSIVRGSVLPPGASGLDYYELIAGGGRVGLL